MSNRLIKQGWGRARGTSMAHVCLFKHPTTKQWHTACRKKLDVPIRVSIADVRPPLRCDDCIIYARQKALKWALEDL